MMGEERFDLGPIITRAMRTVAPLDFEEERDLARRAQAGDAWALDRLVKSHMRFIVRRAHRFHRSSKSVALADLVQEGCAGLVRAIECFDPEHGARLLTYARHFIEVFMRRVVMRHVSIVHYGTTPEQQAIFWRGHAIINRLHAEEGRGHVTHADLQAVADNVGTTPERVRATFQRLHDPDVSLSTPVGKDGGDTDLQAMFADPRSDDPLALAERHEHIRQIRRAIADCALCLDPRERVILNRRLLAVDPETLNVLGDDLGVSRERVRQLESKILRKLREAFEASGLERELDQAS